MNESPFDRGDTVVAIAGDWHGSTSWAQTAIPFLGRLGVQTIYHLGDLGYMGESRGTGYARRLDDWLTEADIILACTPGNHSNWAALDQGFAEHPGQQLVLEPRVRMLPRGFRWTHAGRSFVSLGGGPSIDRDTRIPFRTWWPTEAITDQDVQDVVAGGHAEIMLTHDAPLTGTKIVARIRDAKPLASTPKIEATYQYAREGAERVETAFRAVRPHAAFHGHFHQAAKIELPTGQRVFSLDREWTRGNLGLLDLTTLNFQWVDPRKPGLTWNEPI